MGAKRAELPKPLLPAFGGTTNRYCIEGHPATVRNKPPGDLSMLKVGTEGKELLERQSLDIFTLMVNDGRPFSEALAAILLTGLQWGVALSAEVK